MDGLAAGSVKRPPRVTTVPCAHQARRQVAQALAASTPGPSLPQAAWPLSCAMCRQCVGLLRPGSAEEVLPVTQHGCQLQDSTSNQLLARVGQLVVEQRLLPHNDPSGKVRGYLPMQGGTQTHT